MPGQEDRPEDVDTRLGVLTTLVEHLTDGLKEATSELRRTNDSVQTLRSQSELFRERMDNMSREVWDKNNASRIQSLELHVKGLYALVLFIATAVAGKLAPDLFHYITNGK